MSRCLSWSAPIYAFPAISLLISNDFPPSKVTFSTSILSLELLKDPLYFWNEYKGKVH
jgi:hypothetical protein